MNIMHAWNLCLNGKISGWEHWSLTLWVWIDNVWSPRIVLMSCSRFTDEIPRSLTFISTEKNSLSIFLNWWKESGYIFICLKCRTVVGTIWTLWLSWMSNCSGNIHPPLFQSALILQIIRHTPLSAISFRQTEAIRNLPFLTFSHTTITPKH
jgi:hypothetical protein